MGFSPILFEDTTPPGFDKGLLLRLTNHPTATVHIGWIANTYYIAIGTDTIHCPTPEDVLAQDVLLQMAIPELEKRGINTPIKWQNRDAVQSIAHDNQPQYGILLNRESAYPAITWKQNPLLSTTFHLAYGMPQFQQRSPGVNTLIQETLPMERSIIPLAENIHRLTQFSAHDKMALLTPDHPIWEEMRTAAVQRRTNHTPMPSRKGHIWFDSIRYHFSIPGIGQGTLQDPENIPVIHMRYQKDRMSLRYGYNHETLMLNRGSGGDSRFNSTQDAQTAAQKAVALLDAIPYVFPLMRTGNPSTDLDTQKDVILGPALIHAKKAALRKIAKRNKIAQEQEKAQKILETLPLGRLCGTYKYTRGQAQYTAAIATVENGKKRLYGIYNHATRPLTKKWLAFSPPFPNSDILTRLPFLSYKEETRLHIETAHRASFHAPISMLDATYIPGQAYDGYMTGTLKGKHGETLCAWSHDTTTASGWALCFDLFLPDGLFIRPIIERTHNHLPDASRTAMLEVMRIPSFAQHESRVEKATHLINSYPKKQDLRWQRRPEST